IDLDDLVFSFHNVTVPGDEYFTFIVKKDSLWLRGLAGKTVKLERDRRRRRRRSRWRRRAHFPKLSGRSYHRRNLYFFHLENISSAGFILYILAGSQLGDVQP